MALQSQPRIKEARLKSLLKGINRFGHNAQSGGFNRIGFSDEDMAARQWLAEQMRAEGLAVHWDAAANVCGRYGPPDWPCVMIGSHLDTVPEGGPLDGALGVAAAFESLLALRDSGLALTHPVEVIATSEEEGRFGGMLGSQALAGLVTLAWLKQARDAEGQRLWDAMEAQGFDPRRIADARRPKGSIRLFLELHIEQGPVLEHAGDAIGVVDRISGMISWSVRLTGRSNHAGTTPMDLRADAFAGLAEIATAIPGIIRTHGTKSSRITIGKVQLHPNFPHSVPGQADFSVILRDDQAAVIDRLCAVLRDSIAGLCRKHGLTSEITPRSELAPVALDPQIAAVLCEEAGALGLTHRVMSSGAGHDALMMLALSLSGIDFFTCLCY